MNRVEPDGPESTKRVDSSDSDSSSESCPTSGPKPVENVISPSGVEVYASTQSTQIASGAGQSLADVVRSPILARKSVDIWKKYHKKRRIHTNAVASLFKGAFDDDRHPFSAISPDFSKNHGQLNPNPGQLSQEISRVKGKPSRRKEKANQKLIAYFVKVNEQRLPEIDFEYVFQLMKADGADPNTRDIYGQTIMHEIAREWHADCAKFFIEVGGDIHLADYYGRTPLHVAAASDHHEMVAFIIANGANVDAVTIHDAKHLATMDAKLPDQNQTPLHFAAAADAKKSCAVLLSNGANIEARDYRNRTPLFVAAELDRSVAAKFLIDEKADPTVKDSSGNMALSTMISKMTEVAHSALDELCDYNRRHRKQYYYINHICPSTDEVQHESKARHPLEVIVKEEKIDIISHPIIQKLVHILWVRHGRREAQKDAIFTFFLLFCWSVIALAVPFNERFYYEYPRDWWRVLFFLLAAGLATFMIVGEVQEYRKSKRKLKEFKEWRIAQIRRDLDFCHPMRPHERTYIDEEVKFTEDENLYYWSGWNIYDWVVIFMLFVTIVIHIIAVAIYNTNPHYSETINNVTSTSSISPLTTAPSSGDEIGLESRQENVNKGIWLQRNEDGYVAGIKCVDIPEAICESLEVTNRWQNYIFSVTIVILFCRLLKVIKMTSLMGPFIVILSKTFRDVFRFAILIFIVFLGYLIAFWMIYDGRINSVSGIKQFDELGFMLFRLILVDEWPMDDMIGISKGMTYVLVGSYLAIVAILFVNLYIALLSDTFQRIYDNAQQNAAMQRAMYCMDLWGGMDGPELLKLLDHLNGPECTPYTEPWDDDGMEDAQNALKKITHQIYEKIEHLDEYVREEEAEEEGEAARSKKLLVNRSELVDLTRIMKTMQEEIRVTNNSFSSRLDHIEHHISRMRKKPKQNMDQKKSMQLPSLVSYDFKSTVDSVAETVGTIYGSAGNISLPTVANSLPNDENNEN